MFARLCFDVIAALHGASGNVTRGSYFQPGLNGSFSGRAFHPRGTPPQVGQNSVGKALRGGGHSIASFSDGEFEALARRHRWEVVGPPPLQFRLISHGCRSTAWPTSTATCRRYSICRSSAPAAARARWWRSCSLAAPSGQPSHSNGSKRLGLRPLVVGGTVGGTHNGMLKVRSIGAFANHQRGPNPPPMLPGQTVSPSSAGPLAANNGGHFSPDLMTGLAGSGAVWLFPRPFLSPKLLNSRF